MCKPRVSLFHLSKHHQMLEKQSSSIDSSDILSKLAIFIYHPCFKKQTLEPLLNLSLKIELPINGIHCAKSVQIRSFF